MVNKLRVGFVDLCNKANMTYIKNPSLVGLYLLTILEQEFKDRLDISMIDLRGIKPQDQVYRVPENDILLYSCSSHDFEEYKILVDNLRKFYPKTIHVAGGPHVNLFPKECLKTFDSIVIGEGEEKIKELVNDVYNNALKRIYTQEERIDINLYPFPSRKYYPKSSIAVPNILPGEYANLLGTSAIFSRGCPFNCHFCSKIIGGKVQYRKPESIIDEIEYLKKEFGVECLAIKDDNSIPFDKKIAMINLSAIAKTNIKWRGQSRANGIDRESVVLAKKSGCVEIAVGVESVCQKSLDIMNKAINIDRAKDYLKILREEKIGVRLLLILGLPGEPDDIAQRTIDFIKDIKPTTVLLSVLTPSPGSEIYNHPEKFGIIIDKDNSLLRTAYGRFDKDEKTKMTFDYSNVTPFGKGKKREEIIREYECVQDFLRDNNYNEY